MELDKEALLEQLRCLVSAELDSLTRAQRQVEEAATHEEAKPENDKDTRAIESSYLARGQAQRVVELSEAKAKLDALKPRSFGQDSPIALGALCLLGEDGEQRYVLLAPAGAGAVLSQGENQVRVITPQSPIGRALVGKRVGDDAEVATPQGLRECLVLELA